MLVTDESNHTTPERHKEYNPLSNKIGINIKDIIMTVNNEQLKVIFRQALGFTPKYVKTVELTDGKILLKK